MKVILNKAVRNMFIFYLLLLPGIIMGSIKISGRILGADGKVPAAAHVDLTSLGEYGMMLEEPLVHTDVDPSGHFQIAIAQPGLYTLWVRAVHHRSLEIPLIVHETNADLKLKIQLQPLPFKTHIDEVKIIGNWNGFARHMAQPMQKQPDGTFVYEVEAKADTVGYQLLGLAEPVSSGISGTQADYYVLLHDEGGLIDPYRSVLRTAENSRVRIVFEPDKLPRDNHPDLPRVSFEAPYTHLARFFEIQRRVDQAQDAWSTARQVYKTKHGDTEGFHFDLSPLQNYLEKEMDTAEDLEVRQYAAVSLVWLITRHWDLPHAMLKKIIKLVPPHSAFWGHRGLAGIFCVAFNPENPDSLFQIFYQQNPDRKIKAQMLMNQIFLARKNIRRNCTDPFMLN